jgi:hypothetical protein
MFAVTIIAVACAVLRKPGGLDDKSLIKKTGLVLMSSILAIGLIRMPDRRSSAFAIRGFQDRLTSRRASTLRFTCSAVVLLML